MPIDLNQEELVLLMKLLQAHGLKKQEETKQATPFEAALLVKLGDAYKKQI